MKKQVKLIMDFPQVFFDEKTFVMEDLTLCPTKTLMHPYFSTPVSRLPSWV
jgi:hypothetical protein